MLDVLKREFGLAKNLLTFTSLRIAAQAAGAVLPLLVAKFFSESLFGSYSLAKMIVFFITTLAINSTRRPFVVYASEERAAGGKINKSFSVQILFLGLCIAVCGIAVSIFRKQLITFAGIQPADVVFVFLALVGFSVKSFFCHLQMALGSRIWNAISELLYAVFNVIFIIVFYLTDSLNLQTVFLVYFLSAVLLILAQIWVIDVRLLLPFEIDFSYLKKMFNFAKWVALAATATYFINWGDNIVLRIFVPLKEIGVYNFAYQIFKGLVFTTGIIGQYFLPFITVNIADRGKIKDYLYSKRPRILMLGFTGWLIAVIGIPFAIDFVYGDKYSTSVAVFQILSVAILFRLYTVFYTPVYSALKRYRFTTFATLVQIIINLLLAFALVPHYGIKGAAAATVIAYGIKLIIFEIYYKLYIKEMFTV